MVVGIFGSRKVTSLMLEDVRAYVRALWRKYPTASVVSGGAEGVDHTAESEAVALSMVVISFRPRVIREGEFSIERWSWPDFSVQALLSHPTFADWASAAFYRDMLIAEYADVGACWHRNNSPGTWHTRDAFQAEGKQCSVYTEKKPFVSASS